MNRLTQWINSFGRKPEPEQPPTEQPFVPPAPIWTPEDDAELERLLKLSAEQAAQYEIERYKKLSPGAREQLMMQREIEEYHEPNEERPSSTVEDQVNAMFHRRYQYEIYNMHKMTGQYYIPHRIARHRGNASEMTLKDMQKAHTDACADEMLGGKKDEQTDS